MEKQRKLAGDSALRPALKSKARTRRETVSALARVSADRPRRNDLLPQIEQLEISPQDLTLPTRNVRKIDPAHLKEVIGSIETFGFCVPPLIDSENRILDGVIRVAAAKQLGLPVIRCLKVGHLSAKELRLLRLALNRLGEKGSWDLGELRTEFQELIAEGVHIETSGFTAAEIDQIVIDEELEPCDAILRESTDQAPVVQVGDIFVLGKHRIFCGDATKEDSYKQLAQDCRFRLVLTDPPYNVRIAGNVTNSGHREFVMASGEMTESEFATFNETWISLAAHYLIDGGLFASFIDWRGFPSIYEAARMHLLQQLNLVVWAKTNAGMGSLYRSQHELLPIFKKGKGSHVNNVALGKSGRWRSNVWNYPGASSLGSDSRKGLELHPTVKPISLLEDALLDVTNRGDAVLDPFLGSGSTLIAAERRGRICYGLEFDPHYVDIAVRRFENTFGIEAVHEASGSSFKTLTEQRRNMASPESV